MPMATSVAAVPVRLPAVLLAAIRLPIQTAHPLTRIAHPLILAVVVAARQVAVSAVVAVMVVAVRLVVAEVPAVVAVEATLAEDVKD